MPGPGLPLTLTTHPFPLVGQTLLRSLLGMRPGGCLLWGTCLFFAFHFICTGQTGEKVHWTAIDTADDPRHNSLQVLPEQRLTYSTGTCSTFTELMICQGCHLVRFPHISLGNQHSRNLAFTRRDRSIQTINLTGPVVLRPLLSSPIGTCSLLYC